MNNKYTITFIGNHSNIVIQVEYNEIGVLQSLKFETEGLSADAVSFCYMRVPYIEADVLTLGGPKTPIQVEAVPKDLSFVVFWETYAYKIGDRTRTMKLWTALTEPDRIKCLRSIKQYNQFLQQKPSMERLYPETYLKQERFRNEFKLK